MGWEELPEIAGLFWNTLGELWRDFQAMLRWSDYVFPSPPATSTSKPKWKLLTTDVHSLEFGFWGHNLTWVSRTSCGDPLGLVLIYKSHIFGNSDLLRVLRADGCPDNSAGIPTLTSTRLIEQTSMNSREVLSLFVPHFSSICEELHHSRSHSSTSFTLR